jgi:hypothetical protein
MRFFLVSMFLMAGLAACEKPIPTVPRPVDTSLLLKGGELVFHDTFERESLGADWQTSSPKWKISAGKIRVQNARNEGLWLQRSLPKNVRIEFDAWSDGKDGDLKFEVFAERPEHQAGYIGIFGGWKNTLTVLARRDEHGTDRLERDDRKVRKGKRHHFVIARRDNATLHWWIDGKSVHRWKDSSPLTGTHFGFNDWTAPVRFDNVKVFKLSEE